MRRAALCAILLLLALVSPVSAQVRVARAATNEYQVFLPIAGRPTTLSRYTVKRWASSVWGLQGIYVVDAAGAVLWQVSDLTNSSVYEFSFDVGEAGATNANAFDYTGGAHNYETLTSETLTLDGASVLGWSVGQDVTGTTFVVAQAVDTRLPFHADGSVPNPPVQVGTGTLTHTFTSAGLQVDHAHVMLAGFVCRTLIAAALANSVANFNRYAANGGAAQTILTDASISNLGRAVTFDVWHATLHNYHATVTLPTGGPDIAGSWARSPTTPAEVQFENGAGYGKVRWNYMSKATFALAEALGSTAHRTRYAVTWIDTPPGPSTVVVKQQISGMRNP